MSGPAYEQLTRHWSRMHRFEHVLAMANWDRAAMMPPKGAEARAQAIAEMNALVHGLRTEPQLAAWLEAADGEPLDDVAKANLREMHRVCKRANALPLELVEARSLATSRCEQAWRTQRPANDWAAFAVNLREVVRLTREEAKCLAEASGLSPYDALLDRYEPGMTDAVIVSVFDDLRTWLPQLVRAVRDRQSGEVVIRPRGPFPKAAQRALSLDVMALLGFDFEAGRLDESAHPFSGGVPEDTRLTTRYRDDDFVQSLMSTIHETGHARYEQNLPRALLGQPIALARSMALHESQSLSFEMQLGRSAGFAACLSPLLRRHLGDDPALETANLHSLLNRVEPGLIRVDADEVTYPLHVILRHGIEKGLVDGEVEVEDIPALWDEGMSSLLGLDTRGNFSDGCMQDIHWAAGLFGYFPCYTLGAIQAAQWFAAMRKAVPELDARIAAGDLAPVFDWLREHIWLQASRWTTAELSQRASGETLDPLHFRRYLEARYLGIAVR